MVLLSSGAGHLLVSWGISLSGWQPLESVQVGAGGASEHLSRAEGSVALGEADSQGWIPAECSLAPYGSCPLLCDRVALFPAPAVPSHSTYHPVCFPYKPGSSRGREGLCILVSHPCEWALDISTGLVEVLEQLAELW